MEIPTATSEERRVRFVVDMLDTNHTLSSRLVDVNHEPVRQASSKEIPQNAAIETTPPKLGFEVPFIVPRKREIYDSHSSNQEKMVPPKRRRKMNKAGQPQGGKVVESGPRANEAGFPIVLENINNKHPLGTTSTDVERLEYSQKVLVESCSQTNAPCTTTVSPVSSTKLSSPVAAGITKLRSSFSFQNQVPTGLMHSHLASLLEQCREGLERASQHQHRREEYIRELQFNNREEVGMLRRKLEQTTSMLRQEREAYDRSRDALSQMTKKFEFEHDTRKRVTSHFTKYLAEVAQVMTQLRSDLAEELRKLQEEKLNSQKMLAERADLAASLKRARDESKVADANLDALGRSGAVADELRESIEKQNKQIKFLNDKRTQMHKELVSERQKSMRLEEHSAEAKRRLVTFHFRANILTTYFLAMLDENKARRISSKRKVRDDANDLWDVQAALKRLVDGCTAFVENIPDRQDFYGDVECQMCLPEIPPPASAAASKQVLLKIKKEPVDHGLSLPPHRVPI